MQTKESTLLAINFATYDAIEYSCATLSQNIKNTFNMPLKAT